MIGHPFCAIPVILLAQAVAEVAPSLQAYGCEEGWTNYEDHCYTVLVGEWDSNSARNVCSDLGASAASVWSPVEMAFIASIWPSPKSDTAAPYIWIGLRGTSNGAWIWEDRSQLSVLLHADTEEWWSVLDELDVQPRSASGQCLALTPSGGAAVLDCDTLTTAVACKKALPRVYALSREVDHSSLDDPLDSVHLFERVLPPVLTSVPSWQGLALEELEVTMDTHCAFQCYSVSSCHVIELSCISQENCDTYRCLLFSKVSM